MKFNIIILLLIVFFIPVLVLAESEDEKPMIAVMDLEGKNLSQDEADAVTDFLRTDLVNTGSFIVIERDRMKDILKEQELSISGVTEESDEAAKVGKLLNVKFIMVGTLSKLGEKYFLNVRVVDVETGKITLARRGSSKRLEDLTEVSKSVAYQLAGKKYVPKKDVTIEEEKKYKYPPIGIDFQYGFAPSYGLNGYATKDVTKSATNGTWDTNVITKSDSSSKLSFSYIRAGFYISMLYLGYMKKTSLLKKDEEIKYTVTVNKGKSFTTNVPAPWEWTLTIEDRIVVGVRSWTKGKIDPKIFYFSWRAITEKTNNSIASEYSGPCVGFINKWAIDLGNTPLDLIINFGLYGAYMRYKKPSDFIGDKFGISFGGEIGAGLQLKRIGLYMLANYIADAFYVNETQTDTDTFPDFEYEYKSSSYDILKGFEVRIGYAFDMQALFH